MSNAGSTEDIGVRLTLHNQSQFNQGLKSSSDEVDKFGNKVEQGGKKGEKAGITIGRAFSPLSKIFQETGLASTPLGLSLSALSESARGIGEQLDLIDKKKPGAHLQKIGTFGAVGGAGLFSAGAALDALASPVEASKKQLETAITDSGGNFDDFSTRITAADKHMQNLGIRSTQTNDALTTLTSGLRDPALALKYLGETADIAATRYESLTNAAQTVVQIHAGMNRALRQFGITATSSTKSATELTRAQHDAANAAAHLHNAQQKLSDLQLVDSTKTKLTISNQIALRNAHTAVSDAQAKNSAALTNLQQKQAAAASGAGSFAANMQLLADRTKGQAAAHIDTFAGKLDILKAKILDGAAAFGQKYGPAIMGTGAILTGVSSAATAAGTIIGHFAKSAETVGKTTTVAAEQLSLFSGAEDAAGASGWVALGPILLIVLGIAALIAIGYVIYRNWGTIWPFMKKVVVEVWTWIKEHWPLLLAILLGPIGIAVYMIVKHWNTIKQGGKDVLNWLGQNWPYILGILLGPFGIAAAIIYKHWDDIKGYAHDGEQFIEKKFDALVNFIESIPGRVRRAAVGMFDGIRDEFKGVMNFVISIWDHMASATSFTLPKIHVGPVHLGGEHIGPVLPTIPRVHSGGTVVRGGSAIIQPGEEMITLPPAAKVVPLSGGASNAPYGQVGPVTLQVVMDRRVVAQAVYDDLRDQAARR